MRYKIIQGHDKAATHSTIFAFSLMTAFAIAVAGGGYEKGGSVGVLIVWAVVINQA